jgi:hypothetical protein
MNPSDLIQLPFTSHGACFIDIFIAKRETCNLICDLENKSKFKSSYNLENDPLRFDIKKMHVYSPK